jgi:hypothetical protein
MTTTTLEAIPAEAVRAALRDGLRPVIDYPYTHSGRRARAKALGSRWAPAPEPSDFARMWEAMWCQLDTNALRRAQAAATAEGWGRVHRQGFCEFRPVRRRRDPDPRPVLTPAYVSRGWYRHPETGALRRKVDGGPGWVPRGSKPVGDHRPWSQPDPAPVPEGD